MSGICPRRWPPDHRTISRLVRTSGSHEAIAAAKAGIIGLTLAAVASYAGNQLRVNAVAPGLTETPLTQSLTANESARQLSEAMHAFGRLGQPEDIARAIVFLLDPANSWITGQALAVDGGCAPG